MIDALPTPSSELVYWDETLPGFGVKVTPAGRKVFVVLYRTAGAGSRLRKYTIGPYGRVTLHVARNEAQRVLAARTEGRDPATEKREARRRLMTDRIDDLVDAFIKQHVSKRRSAAEITRILKREIAGRWGARSVHDVTRRDVIGLVSEIVDRAPVAANKTLQIAKTFFNWCVGKAIIDRSPCEGFKEPTREIPRDRVLNDDELARVIKAARQIEGPYGGIVEVLALTAQRREEVAQITWDELDLQKQVWEIPSTRTKNGKPHIVDLSDLAIRVLDARPRTGPRVFGSGDKKFRSFGHAKAKLDKKASVSRWRLHDLRRTAVSGMAWLGVPPHVADKILNHTAGTISGVAAVYQRHEFMAERKDALDAWARHLSAIVRTTTVRVEDRAAVS
ncbi:MAG: tyrosine-type recombinase/integrase [Microvirga sp.]